MVNYTSLRVRPFDSAAEKKDKEYSVERLLRLRTALREHFEANGCSAMPHRGCVRLATWNLRDFDKESYGYRTPDALYYIAEIVNHFDIVALQEINEDLRALEKLRRLLGPNWDYMATDQSPGKRGNGERFAFLYNRNKIGPQRVAGEVTLSGEERLLLPGSFDVLPPDGLTIELPPNARLTHPDQGTHQIGQERQGSEPRMPPRPCLRAPRWRCRRAARWSSRRGTRSVRTRRLT